MTPDATLLIVRGFDAQANRFRYDVNPRFGSTSLAQTTVRVPFRVTLDVSIDLGPPMAQRQLERVLNRGRAGHSGARLTADSMRARFSRNVPNLYTQIIEESDSLVLSREQVDSLRAASARYVVKSNALWLDLGTKLAAMGDDYTGVLWLLAAAMLLGAAAGVVLDVDRWWWAGLPGIMLSQVLISQAWGDARFGTLANLVIALPLLLLAVDARPQQLPLALYSRSR